MSRHRNIHNLTEDDYYDDYDYDEYYEEEGDNDAYYQHQERIRKVKESEAKKKKASVVTKRLAPKENQSVNTLVSMYTDGVGRKDTVKLGLSNHSLEYNQYKKPSKSGAGVSIGGMAPPPGFGRVENAELDLKKPSTASLKSKSNSVANAAKGRLRIKTPSSCTKKTISSQLQQRLKTQKSRLSMVVLGHVDAGKSTLMGQVLLQVGIVQKRTVLKYQKEASDIGKVSFALAWIMDEDESERERGVTIDVATKHISTLNHDITILDAPGHSDYVPAMIAGAASADVGLLVVAASPGEFESGFNCQSQESGIYINHVGQTREHVILSRGLGVSQLVVAVNKLDNADWSEARFLEIENLLEPFLESNGFDMKRVTFIPTSGLKGENVKECSSNNGLAEWYHGKTLLEAINNFEPAKRNIDKPLRFIITDMYPEGKGVTIRGRVVQGMVSVGDRIAVLPVGDEATVSRVDHGTVSMKTQTYPSIQSTEDNFSCERSKIALAGDTVDLCILGVDVARISPGNIVCDVDINLWPKIQKKLQAKIVVMDQLLVPIIRGAQVLLHMHSLDIPAQISKLISKANRKDGSSIIKPRILTSGSNAAVEIKLSAKVCVETFNDCRALGRFVLRRGGDTIAVGVVEEVLGQS